MQDIILAQGKELTMSSVDLLSQINKFREKENLNRVRNNDFLLRVEDEIDDLPTYETFVKLGMSVKGYTLTQRQCLLVGMRESKAVRKKVLDWIESLDSKHQFKIPQTLGEALQLAADQAKQLELQAPKVAFVDNCVERGQLMTATQVAQKHKLSAVKLNKFLDELGGVYSKTIKRGRAFVQPFVDKGYGEMKQTEMGYSQALFTASGEQFINQMLISEGVI